jgi:hypothetical protein
VGLWAVWLQFDDFAEYGVGGVCVAVVDQVVGQVQHKRRVVRALGINPAEAGLGGMVLSHQ